MSCSVVDCNRDHYAKNLCRKHYANLRRIGVAVAPKAHGKNNCPCKVDGCSRKAVSHQMCIPHYYRMKRYGDPLKIVTRGSHLKGSSNPRWNGGTSQYPNHSLMKKNRLLKLKECDGKCQVCGQKAVLIHHADEDKSNHALENLIPLCKPCHYTVHAGEPKRTSKFIRSYGISLKEMTIRFGGSSTFYYNKHKNGTLGLFLKAIISGIKTA